jgi:hypothetical protein
MRPISNINCAKKANGERRVRLKDKAESGEKPEFTSVNEDFELFFQRCD